MVRDVNSVLCEILTEHGGKTDEEAKALLISLSEEKRIVRDVWE